MGWPPARSRAGRSNATVVALADSDPETAAALWPGHPAANIALASREIASASGAGRAIDPTIFAQLDQAARAAPIEPQPFIVAGIRAQLNGRHVEAEQAFEAARLRDPRSLPARYFLATSKLQRSDVEGLRDVAALRAVAGRVTRIAPILPPSFSSSEPGDRVRTMFRDNPLVREWCFEPGDRPNNFRLSCAWQHGRSRQGPLVAV